MNFKLLSLIIDRYNLHHQLNNQLINLWISILPSTNSVIIPFPIHNKITNTEAKTLNALTRSSKVFSPHGTCTILQTLSSPFRFSYKIPSFWTKLSFFSINAHWFLTFPVSFSSLPFPSLSPSKTPNPSSLPFLFLFFPSHPPRPYP